MDNTVDIVSPTTSARDDAQIWDDILKLQLDGVMMHVILYEQFGKHGMNGYMYLHGHHAEEEFHKYIHVVGDYINAYMKIPDSSKVIAPVVEINGATMEEKMIKGMELYKDWEKGVCSKLEAYKKELTNGKEYVDHILCDVRKEMKNINLMCNDLLDKKYEELNDWLIKKYRG